MKKSKDTGGMCVIFVQKAANGEVMCSFNITNEGETKMVVNAIETSLIKSLKSLVKKIETYQESSEGNEIEIPSVSDVGLARYL